ncbi:hypothetical protein PILCRDRAFT_86088 [Piloderma croceum F 1598]|uniref:Uncharacterized protein n=1 Tax=Piloderma croceum (strain F 1598) TaxID=765440 RepID=A0A0C3G511_PILCF|nr:hypothetical protein PILCRDRAFT_86088 [Piloderma croceum F 1598]
MASTILILPIAVDASFVCEDTTKDPTGNTLPVDDKTTFPTCKYNTYACRYNAASGATLYSGIVCPSSVIEYTCAPNAKQSGGGAPLTSNSFPKCTRLQEHLKTLGLLAPVQRNRTQYLTLLESLKISTLGSSLPPFSIQDG